MIVKCQSCIFAPIDCNKVNSCKYTLHRFGVLECGGKEYKKSLINSVHQKELKNRKKLIECIEDQ